MAAIMIGGKGPGAMRKKRPPMPAMVGLMLKVGDKGPSQGKEPTPDAPDDTLSARNNAQETPAEETSYHQQGSAPSPTPESVLYHDGSQVCSQCEYMNGGSCDFLKMPVDENGHCQRFEAKSEDQGTGQPGMQGMETETD